MKERYLPSDDMKERYSVFVSNCGHIHLLIIFAGKSHSDQRFAEMLQAGTMPSMNERIKD